LQIDIKLNVLEDKPGDATTLGFQLNSKSTCYVCKNAGYAKSLANGDFVFYIRNRLASEEIKHENHNQ